VPSVLFRDSAERPPPCFTPLPGFQGLPPVASNVINAIITRPESEPAWTTYGEVVSVWMMCGSNLERLLFEPATNVFDVVSEHPRERSQCVRVVVLNLWRRSACHLLDDCYPSPDCSRIYIRNIIKLARYRLSCVGIGSNY